MIEVVARLTITAENDDQADEVYEAINALNRAWPDTPIILIDEQSRELVRD